MCMWRATGAMYAQIHLELSICDQTPPFFIPSPLPPSCPVAALLSSERRLGKCRTSSAELSLHSCWCQLLCPPSLLSPSLVPSLPFGFFRKVSCCHLLACSGNALHVCLITYILCWIWIVWYFNLFPIIICISIWLPGFLLYYYYNIYCICVYITGIPILMAAIIIPSCSNQPCWLATSRSHPTRRSMWEWHTLWGSPRPITTPHPKRTNSTRCLWGTITLRSL